MGTFKPRWKTSLSPLAFPLALLAMAAVVPEPARAECQGGSKIKPLDQVLSEAGIDQGSVCQEQDRYDKQSRNCRQSFEDLKTLDTFRVQYANDACKNQKKLEAMPKDCQSESCQTDTASLNKEAQKIRALQKKNLEDIRKELKDIRDFQIELAKGAKAIQEETHQDSEKDPNGLSKKYTKELGETRGTSYQTNKDKASFFTDSLSSVSQAIQGVASGSMTPDQVNNSIKTPLTREPLQLAAVANQWDKQIQEEQAYISNSSNAMGASKTKAAANASDTGSLAEGAKAASQSAEAAKAASGGGGGGGSGSESGTSTPSSGSSPTYASNSKSGGNSTTGSYSPAKAGNVGLASSSGSKGDGTNNIANLDAKLAASEALDTAGATTGASASKGSALRSAVRDRLSAMGMGGGAATSATLAAGSSGTGANATSGAVPEGLLPAAKVVASEDPLLASEGTTGGDLGSTNFSLGGSDTEAAVNGMLKEFNVGHEEGSRGLASDDAHQKAPEILAKDSASLFLRARETHFRALKSGLVINGLRSKL
jgi:hypothetical protein